MKKLISMIAMMVWAGAAMADIAITGVTAQQRYPWNGLVDIVVTIEGDTNEITQTECTFSATNCETQAAVDVISIYQVGEDSIGDNNCVRHYLWNASADVGSVKIDDCMLVVNLQTSPGGVQLWAGGPCWAECNVGAIRPSGYGYYFAWGGIVGARRSADDGRWISVQDGTLSAFGESKTYYNLDNSQLRSLGYIDSANNLTAAHDAATVYLGSPWRMPTPAEMDALISTCTATLTTSNGVTGRLVTGRGNFAGKSIFLPSAGYGEGSYLYDPGTGGLYWSSGSNADDSSGAWFLFTNLFQRRNNYRFFGLPIRPVRAFAKSTGDALCVGMDTQLKLDCRMDLRECDGKNTILLHYDLSWFDNAVTICITDNRDVIGSGTSGVLSWKPSSYGNHELKLVAYTREGEEVGSESANFFWEHKEQVSFDPQGGICGTTSEVVTYDRAYGELPVPTRRFAAAFLGWYTEPEGGTLVAATTTVSTALDHTLYAHWEMLPSETHSDASYYYTYLTDSTARLEGTGDDPDTIVIPAEMNGHRITEVAADAFVTSTKATALVITKPLMPVTNYVGAAVAERLTSITIGEGTAELPDGFFAGCTGLLHVSLPDSLQAIDSDAFDGSPDFEWEIIDGYKYCSKWLFGYTEEAIESLTHTDTMKGVANGALKGCTAIHYFTCEAGSELKHIGSRAFYGCVKLSSVTLPEGVTDIGDEAFYGCTVMTNFIIPGTVKTVGDAAFKNCTSLTKALIGYGVESIGKEAFYSDWRISEVDIPSTVTNIGEMAFGGDSSIVRAGLRCDTGKKLMDIFSNYAHLREITVKEGDGIIPNRCFVDCTELTTVRYMGDCPALENVGSNLYENAGHVAEQDEHGYWVTNYEALVTYVTQGSTGWDGVEGSEALPQAWPLVGAYRRSIAFWDVPTYLCQFDANGGTLGVQDTYQYSEKNVVLPPEPVQSGYKFAGWWTQPIGGLQVTSDTIFIEGVYAYLYAHWIG